MAAAQVLVVDDEDAVRETLAAVLADRGYDVLTAASGADALVLIHSHEFDLVLTDLRLDDFDGLRLLGRVRERWPNTVTIMLTGYASLDSAIEAMRQGAYDYLTKPCPAEELLATVARGLERRRLIQQLQRHVRDLEVAIDTARDLYSAVLARAEGTQLLLTESRRTLARVLSALREFGEQAERIAPRVDAEAAQELVRMGAEVRAVIEAASAVGEAVALEA